jgi:hypothetical protein
MSIPISKLEHWLRGIEGKVIAPPVWRNNTFEYADLSAKHVAFLKAVRAVSSLHSLPILYGKGLFIDAGTIVRCIMDCLNEIYFLLEKYPDTTPQAKKFIQHFKSTTLDFDQPPPPAVPSKKIHNAQVRILEKDANISFENIQSMIRKTYETFSGYVHSNYPHVMEIYGGQDHDKKFHTAGVPSHSQKAKYNELILEIHKMTRNTLGFIAYRLDIKEILHEIIQSCEQDA